MKRSLQNFSFVVYVFSCFNLLISSTGIYGQNQADYYLIDKSLPKLTQHDFDKLLAVPEVKIPANYLEFTAPPLPAAVDNSTRPFMRPPFSQVAHECGQAAGVGYNFTYEINRARNLPGNSTSNQYPTHFVWNFMNTGSNTTGANCVEAWEILRAAGTPNVTDYGGMNYGGFQRWIDGYINYYHGMLNRVDGYYNINVSTPEGLNLLKHWIYDHLEGASTGSLANFYANLQTPTTLPVGTPEGGKSVITAFAAYVNHCMTIVGYNDSIRYDYNGDGLFTNNIDINGDGIVDMKDWEIGGLKFVNSYGTGYGNSGYSYMMYKTLADPKAVGGIWNNCVLINHAKSEYAPKLTFKVTLKHNRRNQIRITAGVSLDTLATVPEHIMDFPIFFYQGGGLYLQGDTIEAAKTLEFGLDVSPLLNYVPTGQNARYFLLVDEDDPYAEGDGMLINFSLVNYNNPITETPFYMTNLPLIDNGQSIYFINAAVSHPTPTITDNVFPDATIYQPYSYQVNAAGGSAPYHYYIKQDYQETSLPEPFPANANIPLTPTNSNDGTATQILPFNFPFFGKNYNKVVMHVDGYLMFDDQVYPWPFVLDDQTMMRSTVNISPFNTKNLVIGNGTNGMWYSGNSTQATFRWKASIYGLTGSTEVNVAVRLYPDGKIDFCYGNIVSPSYIQWTGGVSAGDGLNYQTISQSNTYNIPANTTFKFTPDPYPMGLVMDQDGLFHGTPETEFDSCLVKVMVRDNGNFINTKLVPFSTRGYVMKYAIHNGTNDTITNGINTLLDFNIKNISHSAVTNAVMDLSTSDPFITMIDSTENLGTLASQDSILLPGSFEFLASNQMPNNHNMLFNARIISDQDTFTRILTLPGYAPLLSLGNVSISDGNNGFLDPGETVIVGVALKNIGGAGAHNLQITLAENDFFANLISSTATINQINANSLGNFIFTLQCVPNTPMGHIIEIEMTVTGDNDLSYSDHIYILVGFSMETFELANFNQFPWSMAGDAPWIITDSLPHQGMYCAQSGHIYDNQNSILLISVNVITQSEVKFDRRVSCEQDVNNHNYDYLAFFIDMGEKGRWDGYQDWTQTIIPVEAGYHTLKWLYRKDYSVSWGKDAAWIDNVIFPINGEISTFITDKDLPRNHEISVSPNPFKYGTTFLINEEKTTPVDIKIFNSQGLIIKHLQTQSSQTAGITDVTWDGRNQNGGELAPGVYLYRVVTSTGTYSGKVVKLK